MRRQFRSDLEKLNAYFEAAEQISTGIYLAQSIDNYIDVHGNDDRIRELGKATIIYSILKAEQSSRLFVDPFSAPKSLDLRALGDTWYIEFARILMDGRSIDEVENIFEDISIVCFNYDRCIQHFLTFAISSLYSLTARESEVLVEKLRIFRRYGSIGTLRTTENPKGTAFGKDPESIGVFERAKSIKTYTEQVAHDGTLDEIHAAVRQAHTIVFLGFGFNPQNLELLTPPHRATDLNRVFATATGFSSADAMTISERIRVTLGLQGKSENSRLPTGAIRADDPIAVRNKLKCADLFQEYRLSLAR